MTRSAYDRRPIHVPFPGMRLRIPYRAAEEWANAVHRSAGVHDLLSPLMDDAQRSRVTRALALGTATLDDVAKALYAALEEAVPEYSWWRTWRLLDASATVTVAGRMALKGCDPSRLTVATWCGAVYVLMATGLDDRKRFQLDAALDAPPPGMDDDGWGAVSFDEMVSSARSTPGFR
jgi:hypothetical protein